MERNLTQHLITKSRNATCRKIKLKTRDIVLRNINPYFNIPRTSLIKLIIKIFYLSFKPPSN